MNKACPVVLRKESNGVEFLAFEHPLAGKQLIKGTIEAGESLGKACARELEEESGVKAIPSKFLGRWDANFDKWNMTMCCRIHGSTSQGMTAGIYSRFSGSH